MLNDNRIDAAKKAKVVLRVDLVKADSTEDCNTKLNSHRDQNPHSLGLSCPDGKQDRKVCNMYGNGNKKARNVMKGWRIAM